MVKIDKNDFIECLEFIKLQRDKQENFMEALEELSDNKEYCNCFLYATYEEKLVDLLKKLTDDDGEDIEYFLYELNGDNYPRDSKGNILYRNESELYDWLKAKEVL